MTKLLFACAVLALVGGCASVPKARVVNGKLVVDSPFDLVIGSTEYAKMRGVRLRSSTTATYDPKTGVAVTNWSWYGECRLAKPYFGCRELSLSFQGEERHLHSYDINQWPAHMTVAECREAVQKISADIENHLGVMKCKTQKDETDEEVAKRIEKSVARVKDSRLYGASEVFCRTSGEVEKDGNEMRVSVNGLVDNKGKCCYGVRVSCAIDSFLFASHSITAKKTEPAVDKFGAGTHEKTDPAVEKRVKAAHKKAAKLRKTIAKVFGVDLDNVPKADDTNAFKEALAENWIAYPSPCEGMTERRASRIEGFIGVPIAVLNLRRAYDGDVDESELEAFAAEFLARLEKAFGGKLPTEDVKAECIETLSTLYGDGAPAFGDSGATLQLDSRKHFMGRVGDLSVEISYAAPQYAKRGDSFVIVRKGAVVANFVQTPLLVEESKK